MATMVVILDFWTKQFYNFFIYKSSWCFLQSFKSAGFLVQEKKQKIDFQDGCHLGFLIGMILATFDQQVTLMNPTKFQELAFRFRRRRENQIFKMATMAAILDFH